MKTSLLIFLVLGSAIIGGSVVYLCQKKTPALPPPVVDSPAPAAVPPPQNDFTPAVSRPQPVVENPPPAAPVAVTAPAAAPAKSAAAIALDKTIDALLDPHLTAKQKNALLKQLRQAGQLDDVLADLKQRALNNPNDPEIPTTLGEAQIDKLRGLLETGSDMNDIAILAMQADQSFNAALKIDPSNYEAQFVKASSLYYWPANPQTDNQAVQILSGLIDQQENLPSQPQFAQTYVNLGNQYQKMGQTAQAQATWQLGLQKFPNNSALQQKLSGQ